MSDTWWKREVRGQPTDLVVLVVCVVLLVLLFHSVLQTTVATVDSINSPQFTSLSLEEAHQQFRLYPLDSARMRRLAVHLGMDPAVNVRGYRIRTAMRVPLFSGLLCADTTSGRIVAARARLIWQPLPGNLPDTAKE